MKSIPACFFPTKVLLIDDQVKFLKELKPTLDTSACTYDTFSNPYEALEHLKKFQGKESYLHKWLGDGYQHIKEHDYRWRDQIYSNERFEQVSTIIVDHTMPGINGIELCAKLQSHHLQKIMLTGEADESIAINAFNEGLIQGFVRKNDPKVFDKLHTLIHKRQQEFFNSLTRWAYEAAKEDVYGTLLGAPEYINIFQDMVARFHIVEYYLLDTVGKFLLVDAQGNLSALYAYHQEEHRTTSPHMEADGYFRNGDEFVFPKKPVKHPLSFLKDQEVGEIYGQEDEPHHPFPIYNIPNHPNYTWGYVPRLLSVNKVMPFERYKESIL